MSDDWRDANQIYGCLMLPPPTPADDDSQAEPRFESSVAARFMANADFERHRVVVARIVHAVSFVHVPRGRHHH